MPLHHYVQNYYTEDSIPPNDVEKYSTNNNGIMKLLQENIVTTCRSRPFHINPKYSSYTSLGQHISQAEVLSVILFQVNVFERIT